MFVLPQPDPIFHNFRAWKSEDQLILCSSGTSIDVGQKLWKGWSCPPMQQQFHSCSSAGDVTLSASGTPANPTDSFTISEPKNTLIGVSPTMYIKFVDQRIVKWSDRKQRIRCFGVTKKCRFRRILCISEMLIASAVTVKSSVGVKTPVVDARSSEQAGGNQCPSQNRAGALSQLTDCCFIIECKTEKEMKMTQFFLSLKFKKTTNKKKMNNNTLPKQLIQVYNTAYSLRTLRRSFWQSVLAF